MQATPRTYTPQTSAPLLYGTVCITIGEVALGSRGEPVSRMSFHRVNWLTHPTIPCLVADSMEILPSRDYWDILNTCSSTRCCKLILKGWSRGFPFILYFMILEILCKRRRHIAGWKLLGRLQIISFLGIDFVYDYLTFHVLDFFFFFSFLLGNFLYLEPCALSVISPKNSL